MYEIIWVHWVGYTPLFYLVYSWKIFIFLFFIFIFLFIFLYYIEEIIKIQTGTMGNIWCFSKYQEEKGDCLGSVFVVGAWPKKYQVWEPIPCKKAKHRWSENGEGVLWFSEKVINDIDFGFCMGNWIMQCYSVRVSLLYCQSKQTLSAWGIW